MGRLNINEHSSRQGSLSSHCDIVSSLYILTPLDGLFTIHSCILLSVCLELNPSPLQSGHLCSPGPNYIIIHRTIV